MRNKNPENDPGKQFLGIYFKCCRIYGRIYKNRDGSAYEGMCPRCGGRIKIPIGKNGTSSRLFIAE